MTDQPAQSGEEQLRTNESPHSLETTKQDSDKPSGGTGHETTASGSLTAKSGEEDVSERSPREDETGDDSDDADNDADDDADDDDEEDDEDNDEEDEDEEDEEEDEPHLKYARLTQHLIPVYRNGDATSAFLVAGDKMIIGTHSGNIHVVQLPMFQSQLVYHAHSASVTSISISPYPPPLPTDKPEKPDQPLQRTGTQASSSSPRPSSRQSNAPSAPAAARKPREPQPVPKIPSNDIYIATASMDGHVCVQSLVDIKDVQLRNFARPLQAVALSPDYRTDRTYLTGGTAGQLILTVGGGPGRSTATTTGTAAATASGWLGSMGLGSNTGKDTILHSGEGTINAIKWSLSGNFVVWLNEHGIKIIRSNLHLDSNSSDNAWKRIGHIDRPQTDEWEAMASAWKGRVEWIDEDAFETLSSANGSHGAMASSAVEKPRDQSTLSKKNIERLLVGWRGTIWIIHVHPGVPGTGKNITERTIGRAEIVKMLRVDCIISGISLYTQNLLLVLAYSTSNEDENDGDESESEIHGQAGAKGHKSKLSTTSAGSQPSGGIPRRQNHQRPELRLIALDTQEEVDSDSLSVSRYERLTAGDYHLGILPARNAASAVTSSRGALEALAGIGTDMWHAAINPKALFSSGASIKSRESGDDVTSSRTGIAAEAMRPGQPKSATVHPNLVKPGAKIFIHSPYDCILGTQRDQSDHLSWLLERQQYQQAWELIDRNPDILSNASERIDTGLGTPSKQQGSTEEFYDDESIAESSYRSPYSSAEKEKRRIGELWIGELVDQGKWLEAGRICGRVLNTPDRWEKWVWAFAGAKRFDEITDYIPSEPMIPPLPSTIYEVVLGHYLQTDKPRFRELLDRWSFDVFDIKTITTALENQLKFRDVREDSIDDGEQGRDWRIVMGSLARLHEANGRHREALKCFIKLQDADSAFRLIRDSHLAESVTDDIPGFIGLRVSPDKVGQMTEKDLEAATSEAITLLVDEAQHGLVQPKVVVEQLLAQELHTYLYFYLRGLWRGEGIREHMGENIDRIVLESQALVDNFADLAVHLFATYNRELLMEYLKTSTSYVPEKAVQECELFEYYEELVYLYSKTGEMKRALFLIIDRLKNVNEAIEFAKEQDDPDLWDDLLNYSMDKPSFIRGLLERAGTAIDPIKLVRRIPEGLEIQGLREGLTHLMKEHEIQYSIGSGAARVLQSEVAAAQKELRTRQRKGIKFEVVVQSADHVDVEVKNAVNKEEATDEEYNPDGNSQQVIQPGHCAKCHQPFAEDELETLLGYACGHVFHVNHLLEMLHKGKKVDVDLGGGWEDGGRYSIGMKVMRARLLRDKVRGGCPLCHINII